MKTLTRFSRALIQRTKITSYLKHAGFIMFIFSGVGIAEIVHGQCPATISAFPSTTVCQGTAVILTAAANPGSTFLWYKNGVSTDSTRSQLIVTSSGNYYVKTQPCGLNSNALLITVNPLPPANFTYSPAGNPCASTPINFFGPAGFGLHYSWNFGDPGSGTSNTDTARNPTHIFTAVGNGTQSFMVTLIVSSAAGCLAATQQIITVTQKPDVTLTDPNNFPQFTYCALTTDTFALTVLYTPVIVTSNVDYQISWGDGLPSWSSTTFPVGGVHHTYATAGSFALVFTVTGTNGCQNSKTYIVFNGSNPSLSVGSPGSTTGCAPETFCFPLSGWQNNAGSTQYTFNFGDGTTPVVLTAPLPASICHTYRTSSCSQPAPNYAYTLSAVASNPCGSTPLTIGGIQISEKPFSLFTIPDSIFCITTNVHFNNISNPGCFIVGNNINLATNFHWDFGDGQTLDINNVSPGNITSLGSASHTYASPGNYTISLTATNFGAMTCGDSIYTKHICISPIPASNFTVNTQSGCGPLTVVATNNTNTSNLCGDLQFTWSVVFNGSPCLPNTGNWSFAPGSDLHTQNATFIFTDPGTYVITLSSHNRCPVASSSRTINVFTIPAVTVTPISPICEEGTVTPTATFSSCLGTISSYNWTFPGGTPGSSNLQIPGSITYSTAGNYVITASATNQCGTGSGTTNLTVTPLPVITATPMSQTDCSGLASMPISFTTSIPGTTYSWTASNPGGVGGVISSGTANPIPAMTLTNALNGPQTVTYTVIPSANGCSGVPITATITVNPIPVITNTPMNQTVCSDNPTTLVTLTSNVPGATFSWTASATGGITGYTASGTSVIPVQALQNPGFTPGTVTYTITALANGCSGIPVDYIITVNPTPDVSNNPLSKNICSGTNTNIILTSDVSGTTFNWTASNTSGTITGFSASGSGNINDILTNTGIIAGTVTYVITPSTNGCPGNTVSFIVTVQPVANVSVTPGSQTICSGTSTIPVVLTSGVAGTTFSWAFQPPPPPGISGYIPNGTGDIPAQVISNILLTQGTLTYIITPSSGGCDGNPSTHVILINPGPMVTNSPMSQSVCSGGTSSNVILTSNVSGTTFTWTATAPPSISGYLTSGTNTIPPQTLTNGSISAGDVTYHIIPSSTMGLLCPGTPADYQITVNPLPSATANPSSQEICSGGSTNISLSADIVSASFSWTASVISGSVSGQSNGSGNTIVQTLTNLGSTNGIVRYTITPSAGGCPGNSITVDITVNPVPVVTTTPATSQTICSGNQTNIALSSGVAGVSFSWTATLTSGSITGFSDGSGYIIAQTLNNTDVVPGIVTYSITGMVNGCAGPVKMFQVTVNPIPVMTTTPASSQSFCSGSSTNILLSSNIPGTTYSWSGQLTSGTVTGFSSGTSNPIAQTLINTGITAGIVTYNIIPMYGTCRGDTTHFPVTVNARPVVNAGPDLTIACMTSDTLFGSAYGGSGSIAYSWAPSALISSGANSPTAITTNLPGTVTFTLTVTDALGCSSSDNAIVNVTGACLSGSPTATPNPVCSGQITQLNANASGGSGNYTYSWSSNPAGFSSTLANPTVSPTVTTTYSVIINDGYTSVTVSCIVTVYPLPTGFDVTGGGEYCNGGMGVPIGLSGSQNGVSYQLYHGAIPDGSAINGTGGVISFGNRTLPGNYTVTGTFVATGCSLPMNGSVTITVNPLPVTDAGTDFSIPYGTSTVLSGSASGGTGILFYSWTPPASIASGGNTLTPSTTNLFINTAFTLTVTDSKGCNQSDQVIVSLTGGPLSVLATATPQTICNTGAMVQLNAFPSGGSGLYIYTWTSNPAGFSSALQNPQVYPIVTTIYTVTVNDGFNNALSTVTVTVNPLPQVFDVNGGGEYCSGGAGVQIGLGGSETGINYQLFLGPNPDGSAVAGNGSPFSFGNRTLAGNYTVVATNPVTGCVQNMNGSVTISINPLPVSNAGVDLTIPFGTNTTLNGSGSGGTGSLSYSWTPLASISSGGNTPAPVTTNLYTSTLFTLNVTDAKGCAATDQVIVFLSGGPLSVVASGNPLEICNNGANVQLNASAIGGGGSYTYSWTSNPPGIPVWSSTLQNPMVNPTVTTVYTVIVNDGYNTASSPVTITVHPLPAVFAVTGGGEYCSGGCGVMVGLDGSESGILYQLYLGGIPVGVPVTGTGSSLSFGNQTSAGFYTVSATNITTTCQQNMSGGVTVTINPLPVTDAGTNVIIAYGTSTTLSGTAGGGTGALTYSWTPIPFIASGANTLTPTTTNLYSTTTYTFTVVDTKSCSSSDQVQVILTGNPLVIFAATNPDTICDGMTVQLTAAGSGGSGSYTYSWSCSPTGLPPWTSTLQNPVVNPSVTTIYTIIVNDGYNTASASVTVTVQSLPALYPVMADGSYCYGGTGVPIGIPNSETNVSYHLYRNGFPIGGPLPGTGSALSFGNQTIAGNYTVKGTSITTGCFQWMPDTATVSILPLPNQYLVTGGGSYPLGGAGLPIGLSGSQVGVNYRLIHISDTLTPVPGIPGTGSAISFGNQTLAGMYYVVAINATTGCSQDMWGSVVITIDPLPGNYTVFGGGSICQGDPGKVIGLDGSEPSILYILKRNTDSVTSLIGTGDSLIFGTFTISGTYTVRAVNLITNLTTVMSGSAVITVNPVPVAYLLVPAGDTCPGAEILLNGSQLGVNYSLIRGSTDTIGTIAGTGIPGFLNFGPQFNPGIYHIVGIVALTGCKTMMTGTVTIHPAPALYNVNPPGIICPGTSITLSSSETGIDYQLRRDSLINVGSSIPGTGSMLDFGPQMLPGTYRVVAVNPITSCYNWMNGSAVIQPQPVSYNIVPNGDTCAGAVIHLNGSQTGILYRLVLNNSIYLDSLNGTGFPLTFGTYTTTGTYTIIAVNTTSRCETVMNGSLHIIDLPIVYDIQPNGVVCSGDIISLANSEIGVSYTLIRDGSFIAAGPVAGTGFPISFGAQNYAGTYMVLAVNSSSGCSRMMNGSTTLFPLPTMYLVQPQGIQCSGTNIFINGSQPGINYQLLRNGIQIQTLGGTGSFLYFGLQFLPGTYTVRAVNSVTSCDTLMSGSTIIIPSPLVFNVTPAGANCSPSMVGLDASELNVTYQLYKNGGPVGAPVAGTGGSLSFGLQTAGNYFVTGKINATFCIDTMQGIVVITPGPTVNAGIDTAICSGSSLMLYGQSSSTASTFWASSGDGTFINPASLNAIYTPGVNDFLLGNARLYLQGTGQPGCSQMIVSDSMVVTIVHHPLANAGTDTTVCPYVNIVLNGSAANYSSVQWTTIGGDGSFDNSAVLNPQYTAGTGDKTTGFVRLVLTAIGTQQCGTQTASDTVRVNYRPLPVATLSGTTTICAGANTNLTINLSGTAPWTVVYSNGSINTTLNNILVSPYSFTVNPMVTTTYTLLSVNDTYCNGTIAGGSVTITALPLPVQYPMTVTDGGIYCEGTQGPVIGLAGSQISISYQLMIGLVPTGFAIPGTGSSISFGIQTTPGIYRVRATNPLTSCQVLTSDSIVLIENMKPVVDFSTDPSCNGLPTHFHLSGPDISRVAQWHWNFGDGVFATYNAPVEPTHTYPTNGTYHVVLSVTDTTGCTNVITHDVNVYTLPVAFFSYSAPTCAGVGVAFTDYSYITGTYYIAQWHWEFGDGHDTTVTWPGNPDITHIYPAPGSYNVTLTVTTNVGCSAAIVRSIYVDPHPVANFSFSSVCQYHITNFTDLSQTGGGGSVVEWHWNFGDPLSGTNNISSLQNPVHIYDSTGNYTVRLYIFTANGCQDSIQKTLSVNAAPTANFAADTACFGSLTHFTDLSVANAPSITGWDWNFGDGSAHSYAQNPSHLYPSPGIRTVTLTVTNSNGCTQSISHQVVVMASPTAAFVAGSGNCSGTPVAFTDQSFTPQGYIVQWIWVFGDGGTTTINFPPPQYVYHTYANGGTYNVTLTVKTNNGCQSSVTNTITVSFAPVANFSSSNSNCEGSAVHFTDSSQPNGGGQIMAWDWNFGDPPTGTDNTSTQQNPQHVYNTGGTYTVTLIVTNIHGCKDTISKPVIINKSPTVLFTADTVCKGNPTHFTDHSVANSGTLSTWQWDFGDNTPVSTQQNPAHTYTLAGVYTVTLTVMNSTGCQSDTTEQVLVNDLPVALFSFSGSCLGGATTFQDESSATSGTLVSWHWEFGDGDTSTVQNPSHIYASAGTYTVTLTVLNSNGCTDEYTMPVVIFDRPTAAFTYFSTFCPAGRVTFADHSVGNGAPVIAWNWTFEPGFYSTSANPTFTYSVTDSTYAVTLVVTDANGCMDTLVDSTVFVNPAFHFTFHADSACIGTPTHFQAVNLAHGDTLHDVRWTFGDPLSGTDNTSMLYNPTHVFSGPGIYTVKLVAWDMNNCVDSVFRNVIVFPLPVADFGFDSVPYCDGIATFYNNCNGNGATLVSLTWDFGDGNVVTQTDPSITVITHQYVAFGNYRVKLTALNMNGCQDTISRLVMVNCITAGFTSIDTVLCSMRKITFIDHSAPVSLIDRWTWEFGDGTDTTYTQKAVNISHTYTQPGTYSVRLFVRSIRNGLSISDTINISITVNPTSYADFGINKVCYKDTTRFLNLSDSTANGSLSTLWNFGEPGSGINDTSSLFNATHVYLKGGKFNVRLIVMNQFGCRDTLVRQATVHKLPKADFSVPDVCSRNVVAFLNLTKPGDTLISHYSWHFGDDSNPVDTSDSPSPKYTYHLEGTYLVHLQVMDAFGCSDTVSKDQVVLKSPVSAFTVIENVDGIPGRIQMDNESTNAKLYEWDFGNGTKSNLDEPVITYDNDGAYVIRLITWAANNCSDTTFLDYEFMFHNLFVPNAFSPDNLIPEVRLWKPVGLNLALYHASVLDTWGHLLWESSLLDKEGRPVEGWDGMFNGTMMPMGTYVWKISATFKDGKVWEGSDIGKGQGKTFGTVTLIR